MRATLGKHNSDKKNICAASILK